MSSHERLIRDAYAAFNRRDIEGHGRAVLNDRTVHHVYSFDEDLVSCMEIAG